MKRKGGHKGGYKKGKQKKKALKNDLATSPSTCANTGVSQDLDENDNTLLDSDMGIESPSSGTEKPRNIVSEVVDTTTDISTGKPGHGRVKVKIKSSRPLEIKHNYPEVQTQNDTNIGNTKVILPVHGLVMENREDSTYSDGPSSDLQAMTSGKTSRKSGSIKIISSRELASSPVTVEEKNLNNQSSSRQMQGKRGLLSLENERAEDSAVTRKFQQRDSTKSPFWDSHYNEKEVNAALAVIKKVMKMDAAEPFNAPVDPIALGIPDYFDVIDIPMDFGTISNGLEHGRKYTNAEDVFRDVQVIWDNCYKYNNKGDYIMELMKKVKKNFLKYWTEAGLQSDIPSGAGAVEALHYEDVTQSHQEKPYLKGKISKHKRKRGIKQHKSGCLCAVCVVRRRRKEREGNSSVTENQMTPTDQSILYEGNQEQSFPLDNPDSEHTSSSLGQSAERLLNIETEEHEQEEIQMPGQDHICKIELNKKENEMELLNKSDASAPSRRALVESALQDDTSQQSQGQDDDFGFAGLPIDQENITEDVIASRYPDELQEKQEESSEMLEQITLYEDSSHQENHEILKICKALFPDDPRSVWNGPHSLGRRFHVQSAQDNPIGAAMAMFLKQQ